MPFLCGELSPEGANYQHRQVSACASFCLCLCVSVNQPIQLIYLLHVRFYDYQCKIYYRDCDS